MLDCRGTAAVDAQEAKDSAALTQEANRQIAAQQRQAAAQQAFGKTNSTALDQIAAFFKHYPNALPLLLAGGAPLTTDYLRAAFAQDPQTGILHYGLDSFDRQATRLYTGRSTPDSSSGTLIDPAGTWVKEAQPGFLPAVESGAAEFTRPSSLVQAAAMGGVGEAALGAKGMRLLTPFWAAQAAPQVAQDVKRGDYGAALGHTAVALAPELIHQGVKRVAPLAVKVARPVLTRAQLMAESRKPWRYHLGLDENGDTLPERANETSAGDTAATGDAAGGDHLGLPGTPGSYGVSRPN